MERTSGKLIVSASDLVGHLACGHLTVLDGRVSTGGLARPERDDPELAVLTTRGLEHEARYLETLKAEGLHVVEIAEPAAGGADRLAALRQREQLRGERERHPILGRLRQAMVPERDRGHSWVKGGAGEAWLGERFDADAVSGLTVPMHDRLRPGTRASIDHLIVGPGGVWVVDAKDHGGTVRQADKGGWFRADHRLTVGGRDRTSLVAGVTAQVNDVRTALDAGPRPDVAVRGALCFVGVDFGFRMLPFSIDDVIVTWPKSIRRLVQADGPLNADARSDLAQHLDDWFEPAT